MAEAFLQDGKRIYVDNTLKLQLDSLIWNIKNDWDFCIIITGDSMVRVGKCLASVVTLEGKQLKDYKEGEIIDTHSYDFKTGKVVNSKSQIKYSGEQEIFEIELENGEKILATKEHKLFTERCGRIVERELRTLKVGDNILCSK